MVRTRTRAGGIAGGVTGGILNRGNPESSIRQVGTFRADDRDWLASTPFANSLCGTMSLGGNGLFWIGAILYGLAFAFGLGLVLNGRRYPRIVMLVAVVGGFLFQTMALYQRGLATRSCPLGNPFEVVQFVTWSATLLYLLVGPAFRVSLLGLFTSGMAAVFALVSLLIPVWDRPYPERFGAPNPWIEAHASLAIFSYGVIGILFLTSLMYLLQRHGLRSKQVGGVFPMLPSIRELDEIGNRLILAAVVVLTFAIAVGSVHWSRDFSQVTPWKLAATLGVWGGAVAILTLRLTHHLLASRFAWCCCGLFAAALLSLWPVDRSRMGTPMESVTPVLHEDHAAH